MKFTLSWLKEYLDTDEPLEKIADKLTMIGLEVEHIDDKAKALAPFVIAKVISAEQHPNADRLRVCMVDYGQIANGDKPLQVVCGAVLRACGIDPDVYQGFAWGMGIDRIAMLKYGINDLRQMFESDTRWINHYGFKPLDVPTLAGGLSS